MCREAVKTWGPQRTIHLLLKEPAEQKWGKFPVETSCTSYNLPQQKLASEKKQSIVIWLCMKQLKTDSQVLLLRANSLGGIINLMDMVSGEKDLTLGTEHG